MLKKGFSIILMLFLVLMCIGVVFASENMTANELDLTDQIPVEDSEDIVIENISQTDESKNMTANVYADDVVAGNAHYELNQSAYIRTLYK